MQLVYALLFFYRYFCLLTYHILFCLVSALSWQYHSPRSAYFSAHYSQLWEKNHIYHDPIDFYTPLFYTIFFIFETLTFPLHQSLFALPIVVTILTLITAASFFIFFSISTYLYTCLKQPYTRSSTLAITKP